MAKPPPLAFLTLLGGLCGLLAASAALVFRWTIEDGQRLFLPGGVIGNYENLPAWAVLTLPTLGGLLLGGLLQRLPAGWRQVGIMHVLVAMQRGERPRLPAANAVVQFCAGAVAIISGQSVDREGPSVHLGATLGNQLGHSLFQGPSIYVLTACGAAAAIAAAFNTPLAGVFFVIEVLRIEYRFERFMPIITASVVGALLGRLWYGQAPAFALAAVAPDTTADLPILMVLGTVTGLLAVGFVDLTRRCSHWLQPWRLPLRFALAGLVTGSVGLIAPQVLGISYDTLETLLAEELAVSLLLSLLLGKLLATSLAIGAGLPGGLIGPSLIMGGAAGSLLGVIGPEALGPTLHPPSFYATIGMIAMLSAVLQAPMTSLLALLELTGEPAIILPGLVAVVIADLISRKLLGRGSVFDHLRRLTSQRRQSQQADERR